MLSCLHQYQCDKFYVTVHHIKLKQMTDNYMPIKDFLGGGGLNEIWEFAFLF